MGLVLFTEGMTHLEGVTVVVMGLSLAQTAGLI